MENIFYAFFAALGAMVYKIFIQPNFLVEKPEIFLFIIFSIIWVLILYVFIFYKNSITKVLYRYIKNSFYSNDNKETCFCFVVFTFFLIIITLCCIYYFTSSSQICCESNEQINFDDWLSFIGSIITILGISSYVSVFLQKAKLEKQKKIKCRTVHIH